MKNDVRYDDDVRSARLAAERSGRGAASRDGLTPARTAEIRQRVRSGAYDSPKVAHHVARRLLRSGDLGSLDD